MSHSVQCFRNDMKKNIETATSNRSFIQEKLDNYLKLFDEFDYDAIAENLKKKGRKISDIQDNMTVLKKQIHKLKQSEKFLRYAHNLHLENCKKYHKRISNLDLEHIEDLALESEQEGSIKIAILDEFGKPLRYEKNSHAYQNVCERVKTDNEHREKVMNYVKKLIS